MNENELTLQNEIDWTMPSLLPGMASSRASYHAMAISAGDHRVAVMREVRRVMADCHGNPLLAVKTGLERLYGQRLISSQERKTLEQVCRAVFDAQRSARKEEEVFSEIRGIYDEMLVDSAASPVALAVASLAASGSQSLPAVGGEAPEAVLARANRSDQIGVGTLGGAIVGGAIGGAIGGVGGAIIGVVVGGIAGGVATACAT